MTRIKRCISVIVLAAFSIILLAGCFSIDGVTYGGSVDDISEKTKNENKLYYLSIMQDSLMTEQLYKLALWYANEKGGDEYAMNATSATRYNYDGGLTSGSYYYVGNSMQDTGTLLNSLNNMVKYYGDREISFKLYESSMLIFSFTGVRELYILGFTITIFDDDDDNEADEPASSDDTADEPASSGCTCTDVDDTDTYCANCLANKCDFGEFCTCN